MPAYFQCKCNGSKEVKVNTGTGCEKGGFPDCPTPGELFCKDGTKMDPTATMIYRAVMESNSIAWFWPEQDGNHQIDLQQKQLVTIRVCWQLVMDGRTFCNS